jgi:exo-beta-1,3-glucanase (GH17 family)
MKPIIFCVSLIFLMLLNCQTQRPEIAEEKQKEQKIDSMRVIQQALEKELITERQAPFITREFDPYLNGNWIGKAISYGFYREGQAPGKKGPSESQILEDLEIILNHWNLIRVYGSDINSEKVLKVIRKNNLPIKVMLGVWLEDEKVNQKRKNENIKEVLKAIKLANEYSEIISAINVGNETQVFWSAHKMEIETLIHYIRVIRNNTNVPVTTADDYNFWNKSVSKSVAAEVDFIVVHIYPLWNGQTLENSIEWMSNIFFNDIKKIHPDKTLVLGEIGWATNYDSTKTGDGQQGSLIKGEVSYAAQEKFLIELSRWIDKNQVITFLFEAFDEPWKGGGENSGPNEIEKHWGVFYENRIPKESFQNFLKAYETEEL